VLTDDELLAATVRAAVRTRSTGSLSYGVSDVRIAPGRLDLRLTQHDGRSARLALALPSSGDPQYWIYAPPDDADDWVQQLFVWIDEEVFTAGLGSSRARSEHEGDSYVQVTPYGWRVSDPDEHARLSASAGPTGWHG